MIINIKIERKYLFKLIDNKELYNDNLFIFTIEDKNMIIKVNKITDNNEYPLIIEESINTGSNKNEEYDIGFSNTNTISSTSSQGRKKNLIKFISKDSEKFSEYMKNGRDLNKVCYYILILNTIIVILGIIFLIVIKIHLDQINSSFIAVQNYKLASSRFYITLISFMNTLTVKNTNTTSTAPDFFLYDLSPQYDSNYKINMFNYLKEDLLSKLSLTRQSVSAAKTYINKEFTSDYINNNVNFPCNFFQFTNTLPEGYIISKTNLFDILDLYFKFS